MNIRRLVALGWISLLTAAGVGPQLVSQPPFRSQAINGVYFVDGVKYKTVGQALAALGSNPGIVEDQGCLGTHDLSGLTISYNYQNIKLGPCAYTASSTIVDRANGIITGHGLATTITASFNGDVIQMKAGMAAPYLNGAIVGVTVVCGSGSNSVGIHHIDTIGTLYDDDAIENCNGTNGAGIYFENHAGFSERITLRKLSIYRNTCGFQFKNTNTADASLHAPFVSNSFGYWRMSEVHFQVAANQTGICAAGVGTYMSASSVLIYNGDIGFSANLEASSSKLVTLANGTGMDGRFDINSECTGCSGIDFTIDSNSVFAGDLASHIVLDGLSHGTITGTYLPQGTVTGSGGVPVMSVGPAIRGGNLTNMGLSGNTSVTQTGIATPGANYGSNPLYFNGSYWNGSSAAPDQWSAFNHQSSGTNPTSMLSFNHAGSPGSAYLSAPGFAVGSKDGYTGTKTAGSCSFTIQGGIITNVTGC